MSDGAVSGAESPPERNGKSGGENAVPEAENRRDEAQQQSSETEPTVVDDVSELESELKSARAEIQEAKDKYLRALADFENLRRRSKKEREELLRFGSESLLKEILPVLDSIEKAVDCPDSSSDDGGHFREGFLLVKKQLLTVLEKNGLGVIECIGKPFDPNFHQAVARVELPDANSETVHEEFARGYLIHDRLLRASVVSVAVPKVKQPEDQ